MRDPPPARMSILQEDGHLFSQPEKVDSIARNFWGQIYCGTSEDKEGQAQFFVQKFRNYLVSLPPFELAPLTPALLRAEFRSTKTSSPGPDGWT
eukprot:4533693-Alexandrium_andersonii.AAC.1